MALVSVWRRSYLLLLVYLICLQFNYELYLMISSVSPSSEELRLIDGIARFSFQMQISDSGSKQIH
jgi:hypothetical protein